MALHLQLLWRIWAIIVLMMVGACEAQQEEATIMKEGGANSALGKLVDLPRSDILGTLNLGHLIFTSSPESTQEPYPRGGSNLDYFKTSDNMKQQIAADTDLEYTSSLAVTMKTTFDRLSGFEEDVSIAKAYAQSLVSVTYVTMEDLNKMTLTAQFAASFSALPVSMQSEWKEHAWYPIAEFLEKWGTHVVVASYTGATFETYSVAESSLHYTQPELEARACLHAEGFNHVFKSCEAFSDEQKRNAAKLSANDKRYAKGATSTTRNKLMLAKEVTKEDLDKFLSEAKVDEQPVRYHFLPIWSLLRSRFVPRSNEWHQATNLGAYYDGWLGFGCKYVEMKTNGVVEPAQWFRFDHVTNIGYAKCLRRCLGCHSYSQDCFHWNNTCMCGGPSCLVPTEDTKHGYHVRVNDNRNKGSKGMGCHYERRQCICANANTEVGCKIHLDGNISTSNHYVALWDQTPTPTI